METTHFKHEWYFNFNFIPWFLLLSGLLFFIYKVPGKDKPYGYSIVLFLMSLSFVLWFLEKRKLAQIIKLDNRKICAEGFFTKKKSIEWVDIDELIYSGKGSFLLNWKIEKYLYAVVVSRNNTKIYIRIDIGEFKELKKIIENKSMKKFVTT